MPDPIIPPETPPVVPPIVPPAAPPVKEEPAKGLEKLIARFGGDVQKAAMKLYTDNYELRSNNRLLKTQVPEDGGVILKGDDATAWDAYRKLGKPADISATLEKVPGLEAKTKASDREKELAAVSKVYGYDPEALGTLVGDSLPFEVKEVDTNGTKSKIVNVKDGDKTVTLPDYLAAKFPKFVDALKVAPAKPAQGAAPRNGPPLAPGTAPRPTGIPRPPDVPAAPTYRRNVF